MGGWLEECAEQVGRMESNKYFDFAGCGGAAVEIAARQGNSQFKTSMSVPMKDKINCDFSYSGRNSD